MRSLLFSHYSPANFPPSKARARRRKLSFHRENGRGKRSPLKKLIPPLPPFFSGARERERRRNCLLLRPTPNRREGGGRATLDTLTPLTCLEAISVLFSPPAAGYTARCNVRLRGRPRRFGSLGTLYLVKIFAGQSSEAAGCKYFL